MYCPQTMSNILNKMLDVFKYKLIFVMVKYTSQNIKHNIFSEKYVW